MAPRKVLGRGPVPCEIMLVGSQPGQEEDRTGVVFSGKTGQELDRFLDGDRLPSRDQVYLTNIYSVYHGRDYVYTSVDLDAERPRLAEEMRRVRPALIVTLGREAARFFLGDVDLEDTHSIPWRLAYCYDCGYRTESYRAPADRLLAVEGAEHQREGNRSYPVGRSLPPRASGDVRDIRRSAATSTDSARPPMQQHVVHESDAHGTSVDSRERIAGVPPAAGSVQERTPPYGYSNKRTVARAGQDTAAVLSPVSQGGESPLSGCPTCGSYDFRTDITVHVIYHIAAGLRNPESAALVTYGFGQLAAFLDGSLPERKLYDDPYPNPVYRLVKGREVCSVLQHSS